MKTAMQDTSLDVYFGEVIHKLNDMQREVLNIFAENPAMDFTNMELARELRWDINRVTPRVYELRGKGRNNPHEYNPVLIESRKKTCPITGRTAIAWQFNPEHARAF